jgi:hypothetical protein
MNLIEVIRSFNDAGFGHFSFTTKLSENIEKHKDGYLICKNVTMGRTGVYEYLGKDLASLRNKGYNFDDKDIIKVYRDEEDVFNETTLASAIGQPVTLGHPDVDVTANNFKDYGKGVILKAERHGENILGDIKVWDEDLIEAILGGLRELSLGYTAKIVDEDGKFKQKEILINHLAVVRFGRAGNAMIHDEDTTKVEDNEKIEEKEENTDVEKETDTEKEKGEEEVIEDGCVKHNNDIHDEEDKEEKENKEEKEELKDAMNEKETLLKKFHELNALPESEFKDNEMRALDEKFVEAGLGSIIKKKETKENVFDSVKPVDNTIGVNDSIPAQKTYNPDALTIGLQKHFNKINDKKLDMVSRIEREKKQLEYSSVSALDLINGGNL